MEWGPPMSLLDHFEAQALLNDAIVQPKTVRGCADRLVSFLKRYLPKFYRVEQRKHATLVIRGLLSGLERKTCEPIAIQASRRWRNRPRSTRRSLRTSRS